MTKAQLQTEIDTLRGNMVDLVDYLRRTAADRNDEAHREDLPAFSRGLAGGTSNGFSLSAQWIMEALTQQR